MCLLIIIILPINQTIISYNLSNTTRQPQKKMSEIIVVYKFLFSVHIGEATKKSSYLHNFH